MGKYDDIINLPHYVSKTRPHMSIHDRAAQFSSFAALSGHKEAIVETARITDSRIELDESEKAEIDLKLRELSDKISTAPKVRITYFQPDKLKSGGAYVTVSDSVIKVDTFRRVVIMGNNVKIPFDNLYGIADE